MFWSDLDLSEATDQELRNATRELEDLLTDESFEENWDSIREELEIIREFSK